MTDGTYSSELYITKHIKEHMRLMRAEQFANSCLEDFNSFNQEEFDYNELFTMDKGSLIALSPNPSITSSEALYVLYDIETCPYTDEKVPVIIQVSDFMEDWHYEYRKFVNSQFIESLPELNLKFYRKKKCNALKFMEDII